MPRHPDPDLEERVLRAAEVLWSLGGEGALTMRAVAQAAGSNTPAVYRRFKDREDLIRALLLRMASRLRGYFEKGETIEEMADAYVEYALRVPHEYKLFYAYSRLLSPKKGKGEARPIRETRPNFAFVEQILARQLGGRPADHTQTSLQLWALLHGAAMLMLNGSVPEGHEEEMRAACRAALKALIGGAAGKKIQKNW